MTASTTRKLTPLQYAAALLGAFAVVALAPAGLANAADNEQTPTTGAGCTHTDSGGYEIPMDDQQDVFVDGKIVSCRNGKIIITNPPKRGVGTVRGPLVNGNAPVLSAKN